MRKVKSKVDEKTTYRVTDKHITILRDGESVTITHGRLDGFASRLKEDFRNELLAIRLEQRGRDCPICGTRFYKVRSNIYCTPECAAEANRRKTKKRNELLKEVRIIPEEPKMRISEAGRIEREARKKGLHYADIQKAETLAMIGRINTNIEPVKKRFIIYD